MAPYHIHLERLLAAAPEEVWRALTEPELLAAWLMANDFAAQEGHAFTLRCRPTFGWDGTVRGTVLEAVAPRRLSYTWIGAPDMPETVVTWFLRPAGGATLLMLSHTGFRGLKYGLVGRMLGYGWRDMLARGLPSVLLRQQAGSGSRPVPGLSAETGYERA